MVRKSSFSIITVNLLSFALFQVLIAGSIKSAHGHISAFISTDGKPNMNPRTIRRPTVPPPAPELLGAGDLEYSPGFIRNLVKLPGLGQHQQLNGDEKHRISLMFENPYANVNKGVKDVGDGGDQDFPRNDEDDEGSATFTPFISARALSNIPGFFQHLRENLEALKLDQGPDYDDDDDMGTEHPSGKGEADLEDFGLTLQSPEEYLKLNPFHSERIQKLRWQPPASGLMKNQGYHSQKTRSFVEERQPYLREAFIRRAAVSNYNPAWSYTKLGLGKRRR